MSEDKAEIPEEKLVEEVVEEVPEEEVVEEVAEADSDGPYYCDPCGSGTVKKKCPDCGKKLN